MTSGTSQACRGDCAADTEAAGGKRAVPAGPRHSVKVWARHRPPHVCQPGRGLRAQSRARRWVGTVTPRVSGSCLPAGALQAEAGAGEGRHGNARAGHADLAKKGVRAAERAGTYTARLRQLPYRSMADVPGIAARGVS